MNAKTPAAVSATLTVLILILLGVLFVLFQMLALNGASERQGMIAMGMALACQSVVVIFLGMFAAWTTNFLIAKVGWDRILAVIVTVLVTGAIGGALSFLATLLAIPVSGIR